MIWCAYIARLITYHSIIQYPWSHTACEFTPTHKDCPVTYIHEYSTEIKLDIRACIYTLGTIFFVVLGTRTCNINARVISIEHINITELNRVIFTLSRDNWS